MKTLTYSVDDKIFAMAPGYQRAIIVCTGITNSRSGSAIESVLRTAEARLKNRFTTDTLLADARISSWRQAFRTAGMNPGEFRPGHEALARRAVQGKELPVINNAVAIGNAASLTHLMPVGVHPIGPDNNSLTLRVASGTERFTPFGSDEREQPKPGEIVFTDGSEVLTRAWVWRQAAGSVTTEASRNVVINIDGLSPAGADDVARAAAEIETMMAGVCGGLLVRHIVTRESPTVEFTI